VAGDNSLIAFHPFAEVLVVDTSDIRTANGRSLHTQQHLAMAWLRNRGLSEFHGVIAG
jgi:hypothetical protein